MSLLASSNRNEDFFIRRWKSDGVTPLEIWDLMIGDKNLWEWQEHHDYPEVLRQALKSLQDGVAVSQSKEVIDPVSHHFDSVFVTGGRSRNRDIQSAILSLNLPVLFGRNPVYGACLAAVDSFQSGGEKILVVDVGQTQIKMVFDGTASCVARNLTDLPLPEEGKYPDLKMQRSTLSAFIGESIGNFLSKISARPTKAILALPCFIHPDLRLGGSSYIGMKTNETLLHEVISAASLTDVPWLITNDAELAALRVETHSELLDSKKILVLTLGFGTGACMLEHQKK